MSRSINFQLLALILVTATLAGCSSQPVSSEEMQIRNERIEGLITRAGDFSHAGAGARGGR